MQTAAPEPPYHVTPHARITSPRTPVITSPKVTKRRPLVSLRARRPVRRCAEAPHARITSPRTPVITSPKLTKRRPLVSLRARRPVRRCAEAPHARYNVTPHARYNVTKGHETAAPKPSVLTRPATGPAMRGSPARPL